MQPFKALYEHPWTIAVITDAKTLSVNDKLVDERGFYVQKLAFFLANTLTWCKQLDLSAEFLTNFDYTKRINSSRADHLIYTAENYLIRLNSSYDRVLHLANCTFHLGIHEESVNHAVIVTNYKVSHCPEVVAEIKRIKKNLSKYAQDRHTLVHRHSIRDEKLRRIELFYTVDPELLNKTDEWKRNFRSMRTSLLREYVTKKKSEVVNINTDLAGRFQDLFTLLHEEYKRQLDIFQQRGF